jgi:hypothetical protein
MTTISFFALALLLGMLSMAFILVTVREFRKMDEEPEAYPVQFMGHRDDLRFAKVPVRASERRRLRR